MNNRAWAILTDEEKQAVSLSVNHNKSSWQAGEILNKAHYKFLEINARAKQFFKIFHLHYEKYDALIPKECNITWDFQEFILCTIQNRKGYRETLEIIGKGSPLTVKKAHNRLTALIEYLEKLKDSKVEAETDLYELILEFDRWNNFRILPEELQQPSAFKRRNKTRLLKHLKQLKTLDVFLIDRLLNKFSAPKSYHMRVLHLPLVSDTFPDGQQVIRVKATTKNIKYISRYLHLYMFSEREDADEYAYLVEEYLNMESKDCKKGQKFWPHFRTLISKADNYSVINNIIPRRNKLETSFKDMDALLAKKIADKKPNINGAVGSANAASFWDI